MSEKKQKKGKRRNIWNWMEGFKGDKVILIVALLLMLISVISVFSSTPLLAMETGVDRIDIMTTQLKVVGIGVVVILLLYIFGRSGFYRWFGRFAFALSLAMLVVLVFNLNLGFIQAGEINGARRIIKVFGKQLHVYEFVKVFMVLYLAWALDAYKRGEFRLNKLLADLSPKLFGWTTRPLGEKFVYIYQPSLLAIGFVASGSNSSALFLSAVLVLLILIGGVNFKEIVLFFASIVVLGGILVLGYKTGLVKSNRIETAWHRITNDDSATMTPSCAPRSAPRSTRRPGTSCGSPSAPCWRSRRAACWARASATARRNTRSPSSSATTCSASSSRRPGSSGPSSSSCCTSACSPGARRSPRTATTTSTRSWWRASPSSSPDRPLCI